MEETAVKKTSYRKILKHSSIYIFGMILSKAVSFILLPLYTRYLTPEDYGVLGLIYMTSDVLTMLLAMGLTASVLRFYSAEEIQENKNKVISTALIAGSILFVGIFGILSFYAGLTSQIVFGSTDYTPHCRLMYFTMVLFATIEVPLAYLRASARSFEFVIINTVRLVLQLGLNIWFIVFLGQGVLGVLYSTLITFVVISAYLVFMTIKSCGFHFSFEMFKKMIVYGFPLIFAEVGAFIITFSNRYILNAYSTLTEVGLFNLGYKFGMVVTMMFLIPFHQHWAAEMFEIDKRSDKERAFARVFTMVMGISLILLFGVSVYVREVIKVMSNPEYLDAYKVVPIICLAYFFSGMMDYVQLGVLIKKRTKYVAYSTAVAAGICLLLNFALIPYFGMYGAAGATVAAFLARFILTYIWSQKLYPLKYEWSRIIVLFFYTAVILLASLYFSFDNAVYGFAKDTLFLAVYLVVVYLAWLNPNERQLAVQILKKPRQAFKSITGS